ncbi:fimbrial protein, partial [Salmonella enterica]|uniref:fimbrial protein n=1 Tax=Salmonella enterica TaxID=28901 RepID=UPI002159E78E
RDRPCTVKADLGWGKLKENFALFFTAAGPTAGDTDFTIELENCDANVYSSVQARFEGTLDGTDATILKNEDDAENIGVQILDKSSTPMTFNDLQAWSAAVALPAGGTEAPMAFTPRHPPPQLPVNSAKRHKTQKINPKKKRKGGGG